MGSKIIRDPIHNIIELDEISVNIVDTKFFQRLRRIRQLGIAWFVYPCAEHTRFGHSLGAYYLANKLVKKLKDDIAIDGGKIGEYDEKVIIYGALLHDIGHGAFSHMLEGVFKELNKEFIHENMSKRIICEDDEIKSVLEEVDPNLPKDIASMLDKKFENWFVNLIVSSQVDVDRMDYLLRDSHFTGAKYGDFDVEWLLRNLYFKKATHPKDKEGETVIAVDAKKGLNVLEQFLLGRFYMHKHVYLHRVIRSFEGIIMNIFKFVVKEEPKLPYVKNLIKIFQEGEKISLSDYYLLDDFSIISLFNSWLYNKKISKYKELEKLLIMLFFRQPLKYISADNGHAYYELLTKIKELYDKENINSDFLLYIDNTSFSAYKDFGKLDDILEDIFVIDYNDKKEEVMPLSKRRGISLIAKNVENLEVSSYGFYVLPEIAEKLN